jgi:hypothetical protein
VTAISAGVCRVLDALGRNESFRGDVVELVPVVGPDGTPITAQSGEPVLYWKTTPTLIERQPRMTDEALDISAPGIRITQKSASTPVARS